MKKEKFIKSVIQTYSDREVLERYSEDEAAYIWGEYQKTEPEIKEIFDDFLLNGEISNIKIEGFTVEKLQKEFLQTEIAAFLTLDKMIKDPKFAHEIEPPKFNKEYLEKNK